MVLVVKQKLEFDKGKSNGRDHGTELKTNRPKKETGRAINDVKVDVIETEEQDSKQGGEEDEGIQTQLSGEKQHGFWNELSVTNKIDFVAFFAFLFGYFVFNCAYWFNYMKL